jgi:hypothetical protein
MLRNATNIQSESLSSRSKPRFAEHVKNNNNDSDISDENMDDIDENVVNHRSSSTNNGRIGSAVQDKKNQVRQ